MALTAGTRLGPYEIQTALGAGGMGEVYRARDTRLERTVAIKVLPEKLSSDLNLRLRLEREAKAISKLSHAHICTLHDVGHQEGVDFLVMELVEGETLEHRLMKGPLPAEQVLRYAAQIADALAKAHKLGITHRDLKPSNIMLTKSGAKLMDFGLAKQVEVAPLALALNEMTVEQSKLTGDGTILGTFHYMAPEQLEGKEADARTDIFALGEVIYEMATGKPAFGGKSRASLIAAILTNEPPPISQLQPTMPPGLERVVKKCLAKDPEERWQNASDLAIELSWIAEGSGPATQAKASVPRRWLLWGLAASLIFIAGAMLLWQLLLKPVPGSVLRASVIPGKDLEILPFDVVLSPDGSKLAFVARSPAGQALWVRATDSPQVRSLPGTEDARYPFWSPDGQHIGFFAGAKLKTVDLAGGAVITLADAAEGRGGSWNKADIIVFSPNPVGPLFQVPAGGGISSPLTEIDAAMQETSHRWASFLPDDHRVLFYVEGQRSTGAPSADPKDKTSGLYLFDLGTKKKKFVTAADSGAAYASGHLLYMRQENLVAQAFDPERANVTGAPAALPQHQVAYDSDRWSAAFSVAANGLLAYVEGGAAELSGLQWIDRSGKVLGKVAGEARYLCPTLSPEGKRVAVEADTSVGSDIWVIDLERGTKARLTFDEQSFCPVWSPDGEGVAYESYRGGKQVAVVKPANGLGTERLISVAGAADRNNILTDWSRDGRALVFASSYLTSRNRLFVHWLEAGHKDDWLLPEGNAGWREAAFSPDSKWLAYSSDESSRWEVYVVPFPEVNGKFQISTTGGMQPRWRRDGKELFYVGLDHKLMTASVTMKPSFKAGIPQPIPTKNPLISAPTGTAEYDVSTDGKRFLVSIRLQEATTQPITVVTNWTAELKK